jgi:hypothetical protein
MQKGLSTSPTLRRYIRLLSLTFLGMCLCIMASFQLVMVYASSPSEAAKVPVAREPLEVSLDLPPLDYSAAELFRRNMAERMAGAKPFLGYEGGQFIDNTEPGSPVIPYTTLIAVGRLWQGHEAGMSVVTEEDVRTWTRLFDTIKIVIVGGLGTTFDPSEYRVDNDLVLVATAPIGKAVEMYNKVVANHRGNTAAPIALGIFRAEAPFV